MFKKYRNKQITNQFLLGLVFYGFYEDFDTLESDFSTVLV